MVFTQLYTYALGIYAVMCIFADILNAAIKFQFLGGLAQLARASALQAEGHRFDSDILHFLL